MSDQDLIQDWLLDNLNQETRALVAQRLRDDSEFRHAMLAAALEDVALSGALEERRSASSIARLKSKGSTSVSAPKGRKRQRSVKQRTHPFSNPIFIYGAVAALLLLVLYITYEPAGQLDVDATTPPLVIEKPIQTQPNERPLLEEIREVDVTLSEKTLGVGQRQTLPDGTQLIALAATECLWSKDQLQLKSGAIELSGEHSPEQGFVVRTDCGELRAIGTTFQVIALENATLCQVSAGRVEVNQQKQQILRAGQGAVLQKNEKIPATLDLLYLAKPSEMFGQFGLHVQRDQWDVLRSEAIEQDSPERPDQRIIIWRKNEDALLGPGSEQLFLRLYSERAGKLGITLSLHQPRVEFEFNYWDIVVKPGWQDVRLSLSEAKPGPDARHVSLAAIKGLGIYGYEVGEINLAVCAFGKRQ